MHPLDGARLKVQRSLEHETALHHAISAFLEANPYGATFEHNAASGEQIVRIQISDVQPPLEWSILLGEVLHNLRSALDHVVWQLILHDGGQPRPKVSGFPVYTDEPSYRRSGRGGGQQMIDGIKGPGRSIIDGAQPFAEGQRAKLTALYMLNELWNIDKHRTLHLMRMMSDVAHVSLGAASGLRIESQELRAAGPIEDGAEIARLRLVATQQQAMLALNAEIRQDIVFDEAEPSALTNAPVRANLSVVGGQVQSLVERFAPIFDS